MIDRWGLTPRDISGGGERRLVKRLDGFLVRWEDHLASIAEKDAEIEELRIALEEAIKYGEISLSDDKVHTGTWFYVLEKWEVPSLHKYLTQPPTNERGGK